MLLQLLLLAAGIGLIALSGSLVVSGASFAARCLGIRKMVVGATVVAIGTSAPEFVVSLVSVLMGKKDISLGNVVGSNIANVGLALGVAALVARIAVSRRSVVVEYSVMIVLSVVFFIFALTGNTIGRVEGAVLVLSLVAFLMHAAANSRKNEKPSSQEEAPDKSRLPRNVLFLVLGLAGLPVGAKLLVDSSVQILSAFQVPEFVIGATVVAVGTSLPEVATTVIGAVRKEEEIAVGNIIGSNIFNIAMVAGTVSLIAPLPVANQTLRYEFPVMLFAAFLVLPLLLRRKGLGRVWGIIVVAGYAAFLAIAFSLPR